MASWIARYRTWRFSKYTPREMVQLSSAMRSPVVPTKFGLAFGMLMLVMFIWSVNHQLNLGYALTFIIAFVVMFSAAMTVSTLAKLRIITRPPTPVFCGERALFPVILQETEGRDRMAMTLANDFEEVICGGVKAGEHTEVFMPQLTFKRGRLAMLPLELRTTQPLGLFVTWTHFILQNEIMVYPAPVGHLPLPFEVSQAVGDLLAEGSGDDELVGLKPYHEGDPLSRVAWKQLGRGEMLIKQFAGEGSEQVVLDFNHITGDTETRLSQLAKWIVECDSTNREYSLRLPNQIIDFGRGNTHYHQCLTALAEY